MLFRFVDRWFSKAAGRRILRLALLVITMALALSSLIFQFAIRPSSYPLSVGDVATQDIQSPYSLTYPSKILTDHATSEAEAGIQPVYLPTDPAITRHQIEILKNAFVYINTIRQDSYASIAQKRNDLAALKDISLQPGTIEQIINMGDSRWELVEQESFSVLEQIMRNTIRDTTVRESRRNIPTMISFSLNQDQASIVGDLVTQLIVPNSLVSEEQTNLARQQARASIQPIQRTYVAGETIIQRGQVITDLTLEALQQYNLIHPRTDSQEITSASALVLLISVFILLYFIRRSPITLDMRSLSLVSAVFLIFLYGARLVIPNRAILPYVFPLPAFGLTIASLFSIELGLILSLILSILAGYNLPNSLDLTLFYTLASLCGVLALGRGRRVSNFFWAGIAIGAAGGAVVVAYRLPDTITDLLGIVTLIGAAFFNGMASASLTLLFQFLFSQALGLTTALQLLEISRPDHPLLQFILRNAPGTYQHSLQVANLAEQAAESIGADGLLVRVGAIYHDAGKALNPSFFIENQVPGKINPHDDLEPMTSSATIIRHVTDGLLLAKKYRLPPRIQDFIREHHGTMITRYQYTKAVEAAGNQPEFVNMDGFRYPGPTPNSRETALLMLADGCEARARSELPRDEEELRLVVKKVVDFCQREGQLNNTALTLRDLTSISDSFVSTLRNTYHPRIKYPELKSNQAEDEKAEPNPSYSYTSSTSAPTVPQRPKDG